MGPRLGASPPKRIAASWSGSDAGPTKYKVAARCFAPKWRAPLGSYSALAIRKHRSREKKPVGRNQLDIELPIQVLATLASAGPITRFRDRQAIALACRSGAPAGTRDGLGRSQTSRVLPELRRS